MPTLTRPQFVSLIEQLGTKWGYEVHRWAMITGGGIEWLRRHLYFSMATMFIQGLVFSHSFVYHGIVSILVTYITSNWKKPHFQMAAVTTNVHEGISTIMVVVLAHIADEYFGHLNMIVYTNAAYVLGLLLLWLCAGFMNMEVAARVIFGGLVLVAFGEAGRSASLDQFLDYVYRKQEPDCRNDEQLRSGKEAVWRLPWFLGAIIPLFLPYPHWTSVFLISTIVMGIAYLVFLLGFSCYLRNKSNPIIPRESEQEESSGEQPQREQHDQVTEWSRRQVDRARRRGGNVRMLIMKLKERNFLKEILLILVAFLVYSLVEATGSTFFIDQTNMLNNPAKGFNPALFLTIVTSFSKYLSPVLWSLLIPDKSSPSINATLWKIGCGMACSVLSCVAALLVEVYRMDQIRKLEYDGFIDSLEVEDDDSTTISMSVIALVPQFFLLGMMEGLAVEGMIDLFVQRVAGGTDDTETPRNYGSHITDFVLGIGKLITAFSILGLSQSWFHDNINTSRLDHYYAALVLLSSINCCYYCFVASLSYAKGKSPPRHHPLDMNTIKFRSPSPETILEISE